MPRSVSYFGWISIALLLSVLSIQRYKERWWVVIIRYDECCDDFL